MPSGTVRTLLIASAVGLATGCGTMHASRPLPKGTAAVEASVGGGVFQNLGTPIPVPITTLGGRYGLSDRLNVDAHVHGTAAAFGVAGIDLGASGVLVESSDPVYPLPIAGIRANILAGKGAFRIYPEGSLLLSHPFERWWIYYGADVLLDPFVRPTAEKQSPVMASILAGAGYKLDAEGLWSVALEARWLAVDAASAASTVDWVDLGGHGAVGALIGVQRWFELPLD